MQLPNVGGRRVYVSRTSHLRVISRRALYATAALAGMFGGHARLFAQADLASLAIKQSGKLICPGGFPTDLSVSNCEFTQKMRAEQWVTVSFTDQAILGAVVYGAGAWIIKSPNEWGRTWLGLGDRVGVRYTQGAARGTAEYIVGNLMRDDPRHVAFKDDPNEHYGTKIASCTADGIANPKVYPTAGNLIWKRIGHAFLDSVTVRRSNVCGNGSRLPAFDRLAGVAAGAYGGYAWYPRAENTTGMVAQRAAQSYGSTVVGSFYTEFSPEISLLLTRIFSGGKKTQ